MKLHIELHNFSLCLLKNYINHTKFCVVSEKITLAGQTIRTVLTNKNSFGITLDPHTMTKAFVKSLKWHQVTELRPKMWSTLSTRDENRRTRQCTLTSDHNQNAQLPQPLESNPW